MQFDLNHVPFSRFGSYFSIRAMDVDKNGGSQKPGLYLNSNHGSIRNSNIFDIELLIDDQIVPYKYTVTPSKLRLECKNGYVDICISEHNLIRIKGNGAGLRLARTTSRYDYLVTESSTQWMLNSSQLQFNLMIHLLAGRAEVTAPFKIDTSESIVFDFRAEEKNGNFEAAIEEFDVSYTGKPDFEDFDAAIAKVEDEFSLWLSKTLEADESLRNGRELATYLLWSCTVHPEGFLKRPAVLMSKNSMDSIWSWDNCFNAMALAKNNPELAWDQLMIFVDHQHSSGVFPDLMNDRKILRNFCKPPIQGWILNWMMQRGYISQEAYLKEIYKPLCLWTDWWFNFCDHDHDGIPQYNHGNDSGWDNSTIFKDGIPVESPDLAAFLVLQMEVLERIASMLGLNSEAKHWEERTEATLKAMLEHFWDGRRFTSNISGTHKPIESESLQLYIPLILGERLPKDVINCLVNDLKQENRFLTEYGLGSESISSDLYIEDGYWRGAIWPPVVMLFCDALASIGEKNFSQALAQKYCNMALKSGMAENYNALTGAGLRDRGHTWAASVFLVLANEYC